MRNTLAALVRAIVPRLKRLAALRARWGAPGDQDGWRASAYFDWLRATSEAPLVDDKTWGDLEFPKLFAILDTTISAIGRQYLFNQLRTYEYDSGIIAERTRAYEVLRANAALRETVQLALSPLAVDSTGYIADLLFGPAPQRPRHHALILPWAIISVLVVAGTIAGVVSPWLCGGLLIVNGIIAWRAHPKLENSADALSNCGRLLRSAGRLASIRDKDGVSYLAQLEAEAALRKRLAPQVRWLAALDRARNTEVLVGGLVAIANWIFLLKLTLYALSIKAFAARRELWFSTFELLGSLDASVAIASFLHRTARYCRPAVADTPVISFEQGYHPLLQAPVKSSMTLMNRSALVTGSNMTGKTTFIKMIATNVILGHTLGICLAEKATIPRSPVMALIRGDQSVESGKSRYFAEMQGILGFLQQAAGGGCRIFILDEPFSGTNTLERIGAARAVLDAMSEHAQILVTTHDVELQQLLNERFELLHFREDPAVKGFFDYQLHAGAGTQRNAIKVLERMGFPEEIIANALTTVAAINHR